MNPLKHVAIIMDGNGRWGLKYKNSRNAGHKAGLDTVEMIIKETIKNKIDYLTLFAFSTENWKRPKKEIYYLFNLLENFLINKIEELDRNNIKLKILGSKKFSSKLNEERRTELKKLIKSMGEKCKISIRNIRRDANEELKKLLKSKEIGEDDEKSYEKNVQTITDKHIATVDEKVLTKEKEIMTI